MGTVLNSEDGAWTKRKEGCQAIRDLSLQDIDNKIVSACKSINSKDELNVSYESIKTDIDSIKSTAKDMKTYTEKVHSRVESKLENYWKEKIDRCLDLLSSASDLGQYATPSTLDIMSLTDIGTVDADGNPTPMLERKDWLRFSDFMPAETQFDDYATRYDITIRVDSFADLYREEYDALVQFISDDVSINDYVDSILYSASVAHQSPYTWKSFLSDVLSVTVVVPIFEAIYGKNIVTGDKLTGSERGMRGVMGGVGALTLGFGAYVGIAGKGMTVGQAFLYSLGNVGIGMVSVGAGALSNQLLLYLDVNPMLAGLISAGISFGVAWKLGKWYNKSWDTKLAGSVGGTKTGELSSSQIDNYLDQATNNPSSDKVVLGSTGSYDVIADENGYSYFKMADEVWDDLAAVANNDYDEIWKVNEAFIDTQVNAGKEILLSNNPFDGYYFDNGAPRFFQREINYLVDLGYSFEKIEDSLWRAVLN